MQEHFHYTKELPQLQRLFERDHKEIKKLYVRFISNAYQPPAKHQATIAIRYNTHDGLLSRKSWDLSPNERGINSS